MFDRELIKNRFKGTKYVFGFEHHVSKDYFNSVCFGIGWRTSELCCIVIHDDDIEYTYSRSFGRSHDEKKYVADFTINFYIPKDEKDFLDFLSKKEN